MIYIKCKEEVNIPDHMELEDGLGASCDSAGMNELLYKVKMMEKKDWEFISCTHDKRKLGKFSLIFRKKIR